MDLVKKVTQQISGVFSWIAGGALVLMMMLTCTDVLLRSIHGGFPVPGVYEINAFLGSAVAAFAVGFTQQLKGHIAIDWAVARLPGRLRSIVSSIASLAGASLFGLIAFESFLFAGDLWRNGEVSQTQKIPFYPFVYGIAFACLPVMLLLFIDFIVSVLKAVRE